MALSTEEAQSIQSDLQAGKAIADIELLKPLGDVVLRTQEQETKFKENYSKQIEEDIIGPKVSAMHKQYDDDIFAITGNKRVQGVKTYDYLKLEMSALKTKADGSESTINELKAKIDGEGADVLRGEIETWKTKYNTDIGVKDSEIENMQKKHLQFSKLGLVNVAMDEIKGKFIKDLPDYFGSHKNTVIENIVNHSKLSEDGKSLVLLKPDGTVLKNANFEPMSLSARLSDEFKEVIQNGDGSGGAGGGGGETEAEKAARIAEAAGGGEKAWEKIQKPDTVKTQVELRQHLIDTYPDLSRNDRIKTMTKLSVDLPMQ